MISRRLFLRGAAPLAAAAGGALALHSSSAAKAMPVPNDPLLALIRDFRAAEAVHATLSDEEADAAWDSEGGLYGPAFKRLRDDPPAATSMAGVEAALMLMADEHAKGNDWLDFGFLAATVFSLFREGAAR